jgi:putative transposase
MARLPRLVLAGHPMHIMVCGNNRQQIFFDDAEKRSYLEWLRDAARENELLIHAYVLMPNHVHILATPKNDLSVSRTMQSVGRRYAQLFNQNHQRTGTIWEGRFKSCLLEPESFFLLTQKFIESNPVRSGLVQKSEDWPWSSYRHHIGSETISWVSDHSLYWALGNTPFERQSAWQRFVIDSFNKEQIETVSSHLLKGWPLGNPSFLKQIAGKVARPVAKRRPGRPIKETVAI